MKLDTQANVTRRFWATLLDSEVEKDGQVKGFQEWQRGATDYARRQADRYCHWAWVKIQRDHRDPEECVAAGVRALRDQLRLYHPAAALVAEDREYSRFRMGLIDRILSDKLSPIEVARILEGVADRFPQIELEECVRYREMGERWTAPGDDPGWWGRHERERQRISDRAEIRGARSVLAAVGAAPDQSWRHWESVSRNLTGAKAELHGAPTAVSSHAAPGRAIESHPADADVPPEPEMS